MSRRIDTPKEVASIHSLHKQDETRSHRNISLIGNLFFFKSLCVFFKLVML